MKKIIVPLFICLATTMLLTGCIGLAFSFGGGKKDSTSSTNSSSNTNTTSNNDNGTTNNNPHPTVLQQTIAPTIGQQLIDLKKAKDSGAITEAEYQREKAKILNQK